jgi:hypothetical protein
MTHVIFFILFGAGMYFFGALVGVGRIRFRLKVRVGLRLMTIKERDYNDPFSLGFMSGMRWAVDQVMDEPVDWARIEEIVNERKSLGL